MARPRVAIVPYTPNWTYDSTARALARHLVDYYDIRLFYDHPNTPDEIDRWRPDLVIDMWWRGALGERFPRRVLKQVSSHRWGTNKWGALTAPEFLTRHCHGVAALIVPSLRLQEELRDARVAPVRSLPVLLGPKGYEPDELFDHGIRRGAIAVGWAGNAFASDKGVRSVLRVADPGIRLADRCLTRGEMVDFYNQIDVIAIASDAEGDPRTLIEGMACGCYPVATDVGIVPELVRAGGNGLIVRKGVEYFRDAFASCRARAAEVRAAGARNADSMRCERAWSVVAPVWRAVIATGLELASSPPIARVPFVDLFA